jgi:hypothetical protein
MLNTDHPILFFRRLPKMGGYADNIVGKSSCAHELDTLKVYAFVASRCRARRGIHIGFTGAVLGEAINLDDAILWHSSDQLHGGCIAGNFTNIGPSHSCDLITVADPAGIGDCKDNRLEVIVVSLEFHLVWLETSPAIEMKACCTVLGNSSVPPLNSCYAASQVCAIAIFVEELVCNVGTILAVWGVCNVGTILAVGGDRVWLCLALRSVWAVRVSEAVDVISGRDSSQVLFDRTSLRL